jgi:hypothetical protein
VGPRAGLDAVEMSVTNASAGSRSLAALSVARYYGD